MKKIGVFLFALLFYSSLFAGSIKEIVVLGDSLSDNGRLYESIKIVPKSPPYFKGRFSNGPTWAEDVGKFFYDKFYIDTKIFAWGGATAILHNPIHDTFIAPIVLELELSTYFMNSLFTDKSKVLYIIWIGANDYLYDRQQDTNALVNSVVDKISWSITTLIKQGAQNFLILNLPDLSKTPFAQSNHLVPRLDKLTQLHNQKLFEAVNRLSNAHTNVKILTFDVYTAFNDLLSNPEKYNKQYNINIVNTTEACWKGSVMLQNTTQINALNNELQTAVANKDRSLNKNFDTQMMSNYVINSPSLALAYSMGKAYERGVIPCSNAKQYVFWDELHPTEIVHSVLAQLVEKALVEGGVTG